MPSNQQRASTSRRKKATKGPNKSELRAAEVRARQSHESVRQQVLKTADVAGVADPDVVSLGSSGTVADARPRSGVRVSTSGKARTKGKASALTVHKLTREQEYTFIKADLKRLLITAGSLAVVMVVLLFVIEQ